MEPHLQYCMKRVAELRLVRSLGMYLYQQEYAAKSTLYIYVNIDSAVKASRVYRHEGRSWLGRLALDVYVRAIMLKAILSDAVSCSCTWSLASMP
jgi:hypothetical protein